MYDHQLDTFLRVAHTGSFSAAAREIYISASAVSQQMALLEDKLGVKLFHRSKQGIRLTDAGEILAKKAPELIRQSEAIKRAVKANRPLRLGWHTGLEDERFMRACMSMREDGITLTPIRGGEVFGALKDHEIDLCAYMESPMYAEMGYEFIPTDTARQVVVVPSGHPLENRAQISLKDLEGHPLYLLNKGILTDHDSLTKQIHSEKIGVELRPLQDYSAETRNRIFDSEAAFLGIDRFSWQYYPLRVIPLSDGMPIRTGVVVLKQADPRLTAFRHLLALEDEAPGAKSSK
ncbi:MAG: LysR family transcriptional regulator [Clostridia bacterium]|nr:LysR family transcriptional regulator [Clostridia bacterium]